MMVVMLLVDEAGGQLARVVIVHQADDGDLLAGRLLALLADEPIADKIANRFAACRVALLVDVLVEGIEQRGFEGDADTRQIGHGMARWKGPGFRHSCETPSECKPAGPPHVVAASFFLDSGRSCRMMETPASAISTTREHRWATRRRMSKKVRSLLLWLLALGTLSATAMWQANEPRPDAEPADGVVPPLSEAGPRYWKGNLHTHSFWSDGDDFPEMIADWYKRHGYHFLTLSDHNMLSEGERWIDAGNSGVAMKKYKARFGDAWVEERTVKDKGKDRPQVRLKPLAEFRSLLEEPRRFLLIPGEEITHSFAKYPVHMNATNLRDVVKPIDGDSVAETIQVNHRAVAERRKRSGWRTLVFVNHPNYGWGVRAEDLLTEELRFFEIFNGHP